MRKLSKIKVVHLGGAGEPLIQKRCIEFLCNTTKEDAPNLESVYLITNGTLLTPEMWNKFSPHIKAHLEIQVSVDAVKKETYEKIRRGASFDIVLNNLEFIKNQKLNFFTMAMCVQKDNYFEAREFIDFARSFNAKPIFGQVYQRDHLACHLPEHEDYESFLEAVKDSEFEVPDVIDYFIKETIARSKADQ